MRFLVALLATLFFSAPAFTLDYPNRPIRVIAPFGPGTATDTAARVLAGELSQLTGQQAVVENMPGEEGQVGARAAASAAPDGYTIFVTSQSTQAINPHIYRNLGYDPVKSFAPVSALAGAAHIVMVRRGLPVRSVAGLITLAQEQPGKLVFGTGNGASRGAAELFKMMAQVNLAGAIYGSQTDAVADLVAGRIDVLFCDFTTGMPPVRNGRARGLAVTSTQRYPGLERFPTVAESGVPGYELTTWNAVYAPAATPRPIVDALNKLVRSAVESPSYHQQLQRNLATSLAGSPEQLAAFQAKETAKWGEIVRISGMKEP